MMKTRLKELREEKNLTIEELALAAELSARDIEAYESGREDLPVDILPGLAYYFNTSIDYLVGLSDTRQTEISKKMRLLENQRRLIQLYRRGFRETKETDAAKDEQPSR